MDSIFDDNNDSDSVEFGHLDNNQYSDNWMSEIFDTVGDQLLNDQLMTDIVADHSHIKTEALFQEDILEQGFDVCVKSEMSTLIVPSPRSPLVASTNSPSPNLSVESNDSVDIPHHDIKPDIACLNDLNLNNAQNIHSSAFSAVGNNVTISSTDNASIANGNSRSLLRENSISLQNSNSPNLSQRVHYYVRHNSSNPTVYVQTSGSHNSATSYRHVVPRIKRQDVYDRSDQFDNRPDSTTGYVLYPDTPPGSSNSSDSEISGVGCNGTNDDISPSYSLNCYSNNGARNTNISSLNNAINHHHQPIFQNPIPQSGVLILTEEEKRTLISEGYSIPNRLPLTKQEERNLKKIRRKIKNKISAQESRRKKKEYLETLEKKVEAYSQENNELKRRLDNLETTNRSLLSQLRHLQQLAGKAGSSATGTCLMVMMLCFAVFLAGVPGMQEWEGVSRTNNAFRATPALNQIGYASFNKRGPITYYNRAARVHNSAHLHQDLDRNAFPPERYDNLSHSVIKTSQVAKITANNPSRTTVKEEGTVSIRSRLLDAPIEYPEECIPSSRWWWFGMSSSTQEHEDVSQTTKTINPSEGMTDSFDSERLAPIIRQSLRMNSSREITWLDDAEYDSSSLAKASLNIQMVSPGA